MRSLQLDWINCGLIVSSAFVAGWAPFAMLVMAYVLLGPLHYLTEILWLDERGYFLPQRRDARWLAACAGLGLAAGLVAGWMATTQSDDRVTSQIAYHLQQIAVTAALMALAMPLILWQFQAFHMRGLAMSAVIAIGAGLYYFGDAYICYLLLAVLLPTIVHVLVFTCIFMLSGALKARSIAGLLSVTLLIACGLSLAMVDMPAWSLSESTYVTAYRETLSFVNEGIVSLVAPREPIEDCVLTPLGLRLSRLLAFAYLYHYLNWFSKTSVIGWHRLKRATALKIFVLWTLCVGLYWFDYSLGLTVVGMLSFLHVVYEFH